MTATDDPAARLTKWVAHDTAMRPRRRDNLGDSYETVPLKRSDIAAVLNELKRLRADNAALLDGNQRLQTMNDGLRQLATEAREAADAWHQATIDLYSGREEPHPADCRCGRQQPGPVGGAS